MDQALDIIKAVFSFIWDNLIYINMLFAIIVVFFQRKEPKSAWAWLLILYFIPIIGFVFYLLAGTDMHKRKIFKNKEVEDRINEIVRRQEYHAYSGSLEKSDPRLKGYSDLVLYNLETQGAMLSGNNDIEIFDDGVKKFESLKEDIRNAKSFRVFVAIELRKNRTTDRGYHHCVQGVPVWQSYRPRLCRPSHKKVKKTWHRCSVSNGKNDERSLGHGKRF